MKVVLALLIAILVFGFCLDRDRDTARDSRIVSLEATLKEYEKISDSLNDQRIKLTEAYEELERKTAQQRDSADREIVRAREAAQDAERRLRRLVSDTSAERALDELIVEHDSQVSALESLVQLERARCDLCEVLVENSDSTIAVRDSMIGNLRGQADLWQDKYKRSERNKKLTMAGAAVAVIAILVLK